jgi:iron complex transport system substrate-binding protein
MEYPRVVSLLASATEMMAELGCLDWLVGRSHECDYPPEVRALPAVSHAEIAPDLSSAAIDAQIKARSAQVQGAAPEALQALSVYRIDVDLLRDLRPDVILTQTQCEVCAVSERDVSAALAQITGLTPRIVSLAPYRLADVWDDLLRVGDALGRREVASALARAYQARLELLHELTHGRTPRPRVAILEWLDPLMAAGNWTPELVAIAGGENLFGATGEHSPWLAWEDLSAADPDVIVLAPCGFDLARTRQDIPILQAHSAWANLTAVRDGRVYLADGNAYFNRSGPRLVDSAEILWAIFWSGEMHHEAWQRLE